MSTKDQKPVIRYSKEVMIALHDSPLVQKPESMPSLLVWFGEDPDSPTCKNILNGSYMTRPTSDRGIILGPTKTNFASSLYGGLKKSDDNSSKSQSLNNSRHRQLDDRTNVNGIRSPRGPSYIGEKGFSHRSLDSKPPSDRKYMGSSPPHNKQRNDRYYNGDMKTNNNNNRRDSHKNRHYNTSNNNNNYQDSDSSERIPEWMDYTPEVEQETKDEQDTQAQFANDLEAWKSNMKKRDGIQDEPTTTKVEDSFATLSLEPQQPPQQDPLSFFEEGLNETRRDQKGGSRFAKFFAKRETPTTAVVEVKPQPPQQQTQGRSISVTDLFGQQSQQQQVNKDSSMNLMNMIKQEPQQQQQVTSPTTSNNVRVYSEEDVLKSLGANKKPVEENRSNEDVIGFNRVLQILSQPKPMLQSNNENSPPRVQQKGSPMMTGSPMAQQHTETKPTTSRFGNNLPTSVLRQMSARSSEGKPSPSLKSTPPPQHNIHPQQQQQQQHLPPLPPHYMGYHQPMYSPGHPAMMDPRAFEQFVHGMPPPHMMMMPPLPPGQRPMMTPPPHLQQLPMPMQGQQRFPLQQQQQQQQMPPHMTNGIPPQLFNKNQGWEQR